MRVITTHINTDFDGLASIVAASKLYPESILLLSGRLNENVKEFVSLYKDIFKFEKISQVNVQDIEELIVVDTQQVSRLGHLATYIEQIPRKIIFDHHAEESRDLITNAEKFIDETGATVTIIMEIIMRGGIKITPQEATLFALGLYEDTGSFTFSTTTTREITVLKYLAERGLDFSVIRKFVTRPLTEQQKYLLELLMDNTEIYEFKGIKTALSTAEMEEDIRGLSFVTSRMMDIENVDLVITAVKMEGKVHLVGRSKTDRVNLKSLINDFGGGGHEKAASAVLKDVNMLELKNNILKSINHIIKPAISAMDIMSYPVRSILPKDTVEEAWNLLVTYGHSGLPVTEKGQLLGIISHRDLEKAKRHGLSHAPVKGFMSRKVETIRTDTDLNEIEKKMIDKDVGRLPVTDDRGKILGIVSRSDVLKVRHKNRSEKEISQGGSQEELENVNNLTYLINSRLPKKIQGLLFLIGQKADSQGYRVYAVGGFVRDLILGEENYDLDIVVEPNALDFARELNRFLDGSINLFEQFGTAKIVLRDGLKIDLATARTEFYSQPGALPQVELSTIKQDLFRRDFTINTMAFHLNIEKFGNFLDFFDGLKDTRQGLIRVLYNLSFVEDPLRILRAIRFEQRYDFIIEEETLAFLDNALKNRVINKVSRERLFEEISLIFQERDPVKVIKRLNDFKLLPVLFPKVDIDIDTFNLLEEVQKVLFYFHQGLEITKLKKSVPYLCALYYHENIKEIHSVLYQVRLPRDIKKRVLLTLETTPEIAQKLAEKGVNPSLVYEYLKPLPMESLIFLSACSNNLRVWGYIKEYLERLRYEFPLITGEDLKELGYKPGPLFKEVLEEVKKAKMDKKVKSRDEEIRFVIKCMEERKKGE